MALNKFMHPRNPYRTPPDFKQLAIDYPEFRKHVKQDLTGKVKLDFKDEGSVRALTESLLDKDFSLCVKIPPNRLVPTLPLRLNYLLWIQDILDSCISFKQPVRGIDIGTGATCIYPLLAAKKFSWSMIATEIDKESVQNAKSNVEKNNLSHLIEVKQVTDDIILVGALDDKGFDFCMCNPPFFSDISQLDMKTKSRSDARQPPRNAHSGTTDELVVNGGEIAFVGAIIKDSGVLKQTIRIYTVMVGHKCNLGPLKKLIKETGACSLSTTEFCQGRTIRWGLAWTFDPQIDLSKVETMGGLCKQSNKPPLKYTLLKNNNFTFETLRKKVEDILLKLEMSIITESSAENQAIGLTVVAHKNTWSHERRRRRQKKFNAIEVQLNESIKVDSHETQCTQTSVNDDSESCVNTHLDETSCEQASSLSRKRPADINENSEVAKKPKIDTISDGSDVYEGSSPFLIAVLVMIEADSEYRLELSFVEGTGGREAANQVLQYLKNHIK